MKESIPRSHEPAPPLVNRRAFLLRAALVAVPVTLGILGYRQRVAHSSFLTKSGGQPSPLPGLDAFIPLVGSTFTVVGQAGQPRLSLTLAKAEALKHHQPGLTEKFSLRFTPPAGHRIEEQIYALAHPSLGRLELFLSPVGSAGRFHAIQNGEAVIDFKRSAA